MKISQVQRGEFKAVVQLKLIIRFDQVRSNCRSTIRHRFRHRLRHRLRQCLINTLTFHARMQLPAAEPFARIHNHQIIILTLIGRLHIELQYLQTQLANGLGKLVDRILAVGVRQVIASRVIWTHYYLVPAGDQLIALCGRLLVPTKTVHCLVLAVRSAN